MVENESKINTFLSFRLEKEMFAINVNHTLKILQLPEITRVPESSPNMAGIINHHGSVIPVFDINSTMGLKRNKYGKYSCVIILSSSEKEVVTEFGLVVDEVLSVEELSDNDILPPPKMGDVIKLINIAGIYKKNDVFIMILDVNEIIEQLNKK